jgi:DNA-binding FadR family transcriptional regulator
VELLAEAVAAMEAHIADPERFTEYDLAFHAALATATQNELFCALLDYIGHLWLEMILISVHAPGAPGDGVRYHQEILRCVQQHDAEQARRMMLDHVRHSQSLVETVDQQLVAH